MSSPYEPIPARSAARMLLQTVRIAVAAALVSLAFEYGFYPDQLPRWLSTTLPPVVQLVAVIAFVAQHVHRLVVTADRLAAFKTYAADTFVIVVGVGLFAGVAESRHACLKAVTVYVIVIQLFRESRISLGLVSTRLATSQRRLRPARLMVTSFLVVIVLGGVLLSLPRAMTPEHAYDDGFHLARRILNCFFTSTSATCVTGLAMYDTGADFTRFGQGVILGLMQVGGLGIMMFGAMFGLLAGRRMSLADSLVLQDTMSHETIGLVSKMVRFIVIITFVCEAIGAALLYSMWPPSMDGVGERVFHSIFHAVSAFCNAGFTLEGQSLIPYRGAWAVYGSILPLIVLGGLGFPVLRELLLRYKARIRPGPVKQSVDELGLPRRRTPHVAVRLSVHTRIALAMTAMLIVVPAIAFLLFESTDWRLRSQKPTQPPDPRTTAVMADMDWGDRSAAALFLSVTARTAGFNAASMDVDSLSTASHFLLCILMFVGGSPASTAGGVKTVAMAVLMMSLWDTLRRRPHVEAFGRQIPEDVVRRAGVVVVVMFLVVSITALALCYTERGESIQEVLFESVSACCTVGLSTGLTLRLTVVGRVIIMAAMFVGRLGPLTLLIALAGRSRPAPYDYPEEQVMIG